MALAPSYVRLARYGALAFEFTGTITGGVFFGWLVDEWFGTAPWGVLGCTLLGVTGGFVQLVRILRRYDRLERDAGRRAG